MAMQEFLVVEALGEDLFPCRGTDQGTLIGKYQFLTFDPCPGLFEKAGLTSLSHIEKQYARVDIVGIQQVFPVMIPGGRIFVTCDIRII